MEEEQLNGGGFEAVGEADWALIEPVLRENERLFGIRVGDLLRVEGEAGEVYRKVAVAESEVLREEENR